MTNELIEQIGGRERLEAFSAGHYCSIFECRNMARALLEVLEVLEAKPKYFMRVDEDFGLEINSINEFSGGGEGIALYTTPPAASVPDVNFDPAKSGAEATIVTHFVAPEGYKLVPIEPSKEMLLASKRYKAKNKVPTGPGVYRAMIAAAPAPGGDSGDQS